MAQKEPQRIEALSTGSSEPATFIFLHGFDDDADSWTNIVQQFQSANKLPHLTWIFPNAPFNHEARATAWYTPHSFSPIPPPTSSSATPPPHLEPITSRSPSPNPEEDQEEKELLDAVEYVDGLIDKEVERGVKPERIVVGGFSQGCAVSLVLGLCGRWKGKVAGMVGLSGYLPSGRFIEKKLKNYSIGDVHTDMSEGGGMKVFLAHGTRDMLVPMWIFRDAKNRISSVIDEGNLDAHQYEGLGHATAGVEFRDMCNFLEKILP